jgi:hypothetical protein
MDSPYIPVWCNPELDPRRCRQCGTLGSPKDSRVVTQTLIDAEGGCYVDTGVRRDRLQCRVPGCPMKMKSWTVYEPGGYPPLRTGRAGLRRERTGHRSRGHLHERGGEAGLPSDHRGTRGGLDGDPQGHAGPHPGLHQDGSQGAPTSASSRRAADARTGPDAGAALDRRATTCRRACAPPPGPPRGALSALAHAPGTGPRLGGHPALPVPGHGGRRLAHALVPANARRRWEGQSVK